MMPKLSLLFAVAALGVGSFMGFGALSVQAQSAFGGNAVDATVINALHDLNLAVNALENTVNEAEAELRNIGICHSRNTLYKPASQGSPPQCWDMLTNTYAAP